MTPTRRTRHALAVLAVAAPALGMLASAPPAAGAPPPPPESFTVPIRDFAFQPPDLTVHAGDTVTWVNEDKAPHDATTTSAPVSFGSGTLQQGASYSHTFATPGTYSYVCTIHPDMTATVTAMEHEAAAVVEAPPPAEAVPPGPDSAAGAPAAGAAPAPPAIPAAGAAPAPGAAQPATTQAVGNQGRSIDPLLIVVGIALGVTTLCLLLVISPPARD